MSAFPLEPIAMVAFLTLLDNTQLSHQLDNKVKILGCLDSNCKFDVGLATAPNFTPHLFHASYGCESQFLRSSLLEVIDVLYQMLPAFHAEQILFFEEVMHSSIGQVAESIHAVFVCGLENKDISRPPLFAGGLLRSEDCDDRITVQPAIAVSHGVDVEK
jgi:hypothetical protein